MTLILQSQASECALACLAMISSSQGQHTDLFELRRRFPVGLKGARLADLISFGSALGFSCRPLRLDMTELRQLRLPCILHWDLNHFVVLSRVSRRSVVILDPAVGERRLSLAEVSQHFTGVALELTPGADFKPNAPAPKLSLARLTGRVRGLGSALVQIFAVALVLQALGLAAPLFNQLVVDDAIASNDQPMLTVLAIGFGLLLLVQVLLSLARSWMVMVLGQTLSLQWATNIFAHLLKLPVHWFEQRHLGDITSRFGAVQTIQRTLTGAMTEAVLDGLMAFAALALMLLYSAQLTALALAAVAAYGLLRWAAFAPYRNAAAERLVAAARENTHFIETLRAITPLKLFGREQERLARWQNLLVQVHNRDVRTAKMGIGFSSAHAAIFGLENLLVLWLGAKLAMAAPAAGAPVFTVGMLFAFLSWKSQLTSRTSTLIDRLLELKMLGLHRERLADIALAAPEESAVSLPTNNLAHLPPSLELRDVSFRYAANEPWVLRHANLRIEPGENLAITGPSGAGKTTLLKIALGLLPPGEGEVLYGGIPVLQLGLANVRQRVGTVMQDDVLISGSLADNIAFFDLQPDPARIEACAQLAQVHADIVRMPMGYHTVVGDLGSGLSGGQKQRLLLARALYKQPAVLALDEATSHLDVTSERAVTAALAQLRLTRLVIAHRPETVAGAERVVWVEGGCVQQLAPQKACA